jgi:hypothetical protein
MISAWPWTISLDASPIWEKHWESRASDDAGANRLCGRSGTASCSPNEWAKDLWGHARAEWTHRRMAIRNWGIQHVPTCPDYPRWRVMKRLEARVLGLRVARHLTDDGPDRAFRLLTPMLQRRTPFRSLDEIGRSIGGIEEGVLLPFLDRIADTKSEGAWVVVASALGARLPAHASTSFECSRTYIIIGDIWYAADIFGERVPGPALIMDFRAALPLLSPWRQDHNSWVRRAVGVAVHCWAKRSKGEAALVPQANALLDFLAPVFSESDLRALKGIGWGLKTMGKYFPQQTADWLSGQVARPHRRPLLSKAITYLSASQKEEITGRCGP